VLCDWILISFEELGKIYYARLLNKNTGVRPVLCCTQQSTGRTPVVGHSQQHNLTQ